MIHCPDDFDDADRAFIESYGPPDGRRLPDGTVVEGMHVIVSYIRPDTGEQCWLHHSRCDVPISQLIGLLTMSQIELLATAPGVIHNLSPDDDD